MLRALAPSASDQTQPNVAVCSRAQGYDDWPLFVETVDSGNQRCGKKRPSVLFLRPFCDSQYFMSGE